jgi:hypothetical protein
MTPLIALAAALGLAQANPSQAHPAPGPGGVGPTVVVRAPKAGSHPDATVDIDDEDVSEVFGPIWPAKAFDYQQNGHVMLSCRINALGFAQACRVAEETPARMGFGDAALQLQPSLRLPPPKDLAGAASVEKTIAITFAAPQDTQGWGAPGGFVSPSGRAMNRRTGNPMIMKAVTMMDHPLWISAPGFDDMRRAYPANGGGGEGFVVLRCEVGLSGLLSRCDSSKEIPDGRGFGRAALSLAPLFRVSPEVMAKVPKWPVQVMVPLRFAPPDSMVEPVVTAPTWISGFDPEKAPKLFPPEAAAKGLTTGRGVARCHIGADGMLTACAPGQADPEGLGFSEAAVVLARTMRMSLWSADDGPVKGGEIVIPIRLNLAGPR